MGGDMNNKEITIGEVIVKVWEMAQSSTNLKNSAREDSIVRQNTMKWALAELEKRNMQIRQEVVDWVNNHLHRSPQCSYNFCFGERAWKAQLREWGLKGHES
jgi:hypothetical protein